MAPLCRIRTLRMNSELFAKAGLFSDDPYFLAGPPYPIGST